MARVKTAGLHKVAAREHGLDSLTIKAAAEILGTRLLYNEAKYASIRSGLRSLEEVAGDVPLGKTANMSLPKHMALNALGGGVTGAVTGGLAGGIAGGLSPDGTALGGALRGATYGAGAGALTHAFTPVLRKVSPGMGAAVETAALLSPVGLGAWKSWNAKQDQEPDPKKEASMFDLRTLKGLVPKAEQAGASAALPAMKGSAPANAKGIFNKMEGTPQKGFDAKRTMRGEDIPMELPAMRALPKIAAAHGQ